MKLPFNFGIQVQLERSALRGTFVTSPARFVHRRGRPGNFRALIQFENAWVGDFPPEGPDVALLLVTLFEEDRFA